MSNTLNLCVSWVVCKVWKQNLKYHYHYTHTLGFVFPKIINFPTNWLFGSTGVFCPSWPPLSTPLVTNAEKMHFWKNDTNLVQRDWLRNTACTAHLSYGMHAQRWTTNIWKILSYIRLLWIFLRIRLQLSLCKCRWHWDQMTLCLFSMPAAYWNVSVCFHWW